MSISLIESSVKSSIESIFEHIDLIIIESIIFIALIKRDRDRFRKYSASIVNFIFNIHSVDSSFVSFRQKEIIELLEKDVFISINKRDVFADVRLFSFRFVDEIKHSEIEKAFEKFKLMIQTFNDQNKILV